MILDHVTLSTRNMAATRAFFEQVFDLRDGFRPDFPFPGHWLYEGAEPLVHLIPAREGASDAAAAAERIDHVAFLRDDYDAFRAKLERLSIPYLPTELPEIGERRLFLRVPGGVLLEVAFRSNRSLSASRSQPRPAIENNRGLRRCFRPTESVSTVAS